MWWGWGGLRSSGRRMRWGKDQKKTDVFCTWRVAKCLTFFLSFFFSLSHNVHFMFHMRTRVHTQTHTHSTCTCMRTRARRHVYIHALQNRLGMITVVHPCMWMNKWIDFQICKHDNPVDIFTISQLCIWSFKGQAYLWYRHPYGFILPLKPAVKHVHYFKQKLFWNPRV